MDLQGIMLSEVSQTEKDKYHMISLIYGIQNMTQMYLWNRNTLADIENRLAVTKGEDG